MARKQNRRRRTGFSKIARFDWKGFLKKAPFLPLGIFLLGADIAVIVAVLNIQEFVNEPGWREIVSIQHSSAPGTGFGSWVFPFLHEHFVLLLFWLTPAFLLTLYRRPSERWVAPVAAAAIFVFIAGISFDLHTNYRSAASSFLGEAPSVDSYLLKLALISVVVLSPPFMVWLYHRATTLDRYVLRSFFTPFLLCLLGFLAIWLILDLADNGPDFIEAEHPPGLGTVVGFYAVQVPQIVVLILDVTILLAVLYMLGKMSRSNEIISMLGAGVSMWRILAPLFIFGLYATLVSLALNFQWAPSAERAKEELLQSLDEKYEQKTAATAVLYRNRDARRTWFVSSIPIDLTTDNKLRNLEIYQQDEDGEIVTSWVAKSAYWFRGMNVRDEGQGTWRLYNGVMRQYGDQGYPIKTTPFDKFDVPDPRSGLGPWPESPWKLQSGALNPEFLGVQELRSYIRTNADLPPEKLAPFRSQLANRFALPWRCFVVMLVAAPLGIVYSRRGLLGGVASCVFIYFLIFFLSAVSLALGDSNRISPSFAAWLPNLVFAAVGIVLLVVRARNREVPKLNPFHYLRRAPA